MKTITDFIKEQQEYNRDLHKYKYPTDIGHSYDSFMLANHFTDDTITEDAREWYCNRVWNKDKPWLDCSHTDKSFDRWTYINEMMKSHELKYVVNSLNRDYASRYGAVFVGGGSSKLNKIATSVIYVPYELYKEKYDELLTKIDNMMWFVTGFKQKGTMKYNLDDNVDVLESGDSKFVLMKIEPIQSENKTDYVYNKCDGIVYHITKKEHVSSILKNGLRTKGEKNSYRFIKNRVYVICGENSNEIKKRIEKIVNDKLMPEYEILKIDLDNYDIEFYQDTFYKDKEALFTYAYIPPKLITKVKLEDI